MPTRGARIRRRVYYAIPWWFRKNNFQIFVFVLCILGGVPLILGEVDANSMDATLPKTVVFIWGSILALAPLLSVIGIVKQGKKPFHEVIFWVKVEAIGLSALAYSAYIYGIAIITSNLTGGWVAAMLVIGFGWTCHTKELDLQVQVADFLLSIGAKDAI